MSESPRLLTMIGLTRRNLWRQKVRTSLTAVGVAIGVVAIVAFGAIAHGLAVSVETGIHASGCELVIYQAGTAMDFLSILDEKETRQILINHPAVEEISAGQSHFLNLSGKIGSIVLVIGVLPDEFGITSQAMAKGRQFHATDEAVIGTHLARKINRGVGDELVLADRTFKITGVSSTGNVFYDSAVVMHLRTLQEIKGQPDFVNCFFTRLTPGSDPYQIAEHIERDHPQLAAIADASQYNKIDPGLEYSQSMVWIVSFLAVVIGSLIVANTMWMSVNQRIREIGVLRAVGWSRRRIMAVIILEAAGIGALAWCLGCVAGAGLAELTTVVPLTSQWIEPAYSPQPFLIAVGVAIAISILGATVPAYRAANISPVEALRHE